MTYREYVEQFISQFDITHSVTVDIDYRYSLYRTEKYQDLFKQDLKIFIHQLNSTLICVVHVEFFLKTSMFIC